MSKLINCPTCGKVTRPDYCSDECLYTDYERYRITKIINKHVVEWLDAKGDSYRPDILIDLINGVEQ